MDARYHGGKWQAHKSSEGIMTQNFTQDGIAISQHDGRSRLPPPLDKGGVDVAHVYSWCLVGSDWYRWTGRNSVLLAEWVESLGEDLELYRGG
jgi:hypothetical protein